MVNLVLSRIILELISSNSKEEITSVLVEEFGCDKDVVLSSFPNYKSLDNTGKQIEANGIEKLNIKIDKVIKYIKENKDVSIDKLSKDCDINIELAYEIINILENNDLVEQKISLFGKNRVILKKKNEHQG